MNQTPEPVAPNADRSLPLERRIARLERTNRTLSLVLAASLGLAAGAVMVGARQALSGAPQGRPAAGSQAPAEAEPVRCKPVSITLDPSRGSGRWSSSLLAVDAEGVVYVLDTTRPQTFWRRFEFSP